MHLVGVILVVSKKSIASYKERKITTFITQLHSDLRHYITFTTHHKTIVFSVWTEYRVDSNYSVSLLRGDMLVFSARVALRK